jgi:hypothetical protein
VNPTNTNNGPDQAELQASEAAFEQAKAAAEDRNLPELDFSTFVLSLSHSALMHLGDAPSPADAREEVNLAMARQTIDLLAILQEKTRGNLSGAEERIVAQVLFDLRMRYVEVAKQQ